MFFGEKIQKNKKVYYFLDINDNWDYSLRTAKLIFFKLGWSNLRKIVSCSFSKQLNSD